MMLADYMPPPWWLVPAVLVRATWPAWLFLALVAVGMAVDWWLDRRNGK